jgi:hypothetical protein
VTLDEERRSHRQETLHRDGHRRVARTGQAYLLKDHRNVIPKV